MITRGKETMTDIRCEDFEREFAQLNDMQAEPARRQALASHKQNCPFCRNYSAEMQGLRTALRNLRKLETSPQFIFNLKREINRLELPTSRREMRSTPLPYTVALSTGFALAIFIGVLLLRPVLPVSESTLSLNPAPISSQVAVKDVSSPASATQEILDPKIIPSPIHEQWTATNDLSNRDTLKHRLPEAPGKDSIPIPLRDDYWRMNQVSTIPAEP
jgi:hypothetical protein